MKFDKDKLISQRSVADLTQQELADRIGGFRSQVARYEAGTQTPRKTMVHKLAAALGCEYDDLIEEKSPILEGLENIVFDDHKKAKLLKEFESYTPEQKNEIIAQLMRFMAALKEK